MQVARNIHDTIVFLLQNLFEMNKLWIRMQYLGPKVKEKRESDRKELNMVVGENIVRLSSLEGVDKNVYKTLLLPRLLELISNCKDPLSQQYLTDCIIQVFPDEFHMLTLDILLKASASLHNSVDVIGISISLIERLANYTLVNPNVIPIGNTYPFEVIKNTVKNIIEDQERVVEFPKFIELEAIFMTFSINAYPDNIKNIETIMETLVKYIERKNNKDLSIEVTKTLIKCIIIPLKSLLFTIIDTPQFTKLINYLTPKQKNDIEKEILFKIIQSKTKLDSIKALEKIMIYVNPLVSGSIGKADDIREFEKVQTNIAKLVHLLQCSDAYKEFEMIMNLKLAFAKGGISRMKITYPALIWALYKLSSKTNDLKLQTDIFEMVYQLVESIIPNSTEKSIGLLLQGAIALNRIEPNSQDTIEKFVNRAFSLYKEQAVDNKRPGLLLLIIATLNSINNKTYTKEILKLSIDLPHLQDRLKSIIQCSYIIDSEEVSLMNI